MGNGRIGDPSRIRPTVAKEESEMHASDVLDADDTRPLAKVIVLFVNESIDPDVISSELGLEPSLKVYIGQPTFYKDGKVMGRATYSRWSYAESITAMQASDDDIGEQIVTVIAMLVARLSARDQFVREVAAGGSAEILVRMSGERHVGVVVSADVLSAIGRLGLNFGVEVFPHYP